VNHICQTDKSSSSLHYNRYKCVEFLIVAHYFRRKVPGCLHCTGTRIYERISGPFVTLIRVIFQANKRFAFDIINVIVPECYINGKSVNINY
jgi:hypothetical protein